MTEALTLFHTITEKDSLFGNARLFSQIFSFLDIEVTHLDRVGSILQSNLECMSNLQEFIEDMHTESEKTTSLSDQTRIAS